MEEERGRVCVPMGSSSSIAVVLETVVIELQLKVQLTEACFNRIQDHVSNVMVRPIGNDACSAIRVVVVVDAD